MSMLHTVNKSPFERNTLESCIGLAVPGSAILLLEDGVIGAMANTKHSEMVKAAMANVKIYVLGPDLKARGLSEGNVVDGISVVGYGDFVDLTAEHAAVQSWL